MLPLGIVAPDFNLLNPRNLKRQSLQELASKKATVVMFICNHCPYVKHILPELILQARELQAKGVSYIAINSNDVLNYPDDSPAEMAKLAENLDFPFAYLFDDTQEIAKAYNAACTPDFFAFDDQLQLIYRGRFDDATPGNLVPVTGEDLKHAMNLWLESQLLVKEQYPSVGCNIKWNK